MVLFTQWKKKKTLKNSDDRSTGASTADKHSAYTHRGGQCECSANKMTMSQMQTGSFKMGLHEAVGDGGHLRSGVWHDWTHDSWSSELHHCVNLSGDAMLKSFLPHWRWKQPPDWLAVVPGSFSLSSGAICCKEGVFFGFYHVAMVTCSFSCLSANTRQLMEVSTSTCWLQQAQP